jgi:hypothetical protein
MTPKELIQGHVIRQVYLSNAEITEIFKPRSDYKNACKRTLNQEFNVDIDELNDRYFWWETFSSEEILEQSNQSEDLTNESHHVFFTAQEAWIDCARSNQIDPHEDEVMEVWLVSDWLHDKLSRQNESVINWKGLPLWGRTSTGIALSQEDIIISIAKIYQ